MLDGDPYQKHITECVALISQEVSRRLASDSLRPKNISARTGNKLAGEFAKGLLSKSGETLLSAAQKIFCENITDAASPAASAETCVSDSNARQGKEHFQKGIYFILLLMLVCLLILNSVVFL